MVVGNKPEIIDKPDPRVMLRHEKGVWAFPIAVDNSLHVFGYDEKYNRLLKIYFLCFSLEIYYNSKH